MPYDQSKSRPKRLNLAQSRADIDNEKIKDETESQGRLTLIGLPRLKTKRFNFQINLCVDEFSYKLYHQLRKQYGTRLSNSLRVAINKELDRIADIEASE